MIATSDFSGLTSAACALASAEARAATVSLDRGMGRLRVEQVKADGASFGALRPYAVPDRLLRVFGHERLELALGALVIQECLTGGAEERRKLGPGIRCA